MSSRSSSHPLSSAARARGGSTLRATFAPATRHRLGCRRPRDEGHHQELARGGELDVDDGGRRVRHLPHAARRLCTRCRRSWRRLSRRVGTGAHRAALPRSDRAPLTTLYRWSVHLFCGPRVVRSARTTFTSCASLRGCTTRTPARSAGASGSLRPRQSRRPRRPACAAHRARASPSRRPCHRRRSSSQRSLRLTDDRLACGLAPSPFSGWACAALLRLARERRHARAHPRLSRACMYCTWGQRLCWSVHVCLCACV
jgi:hypothetical protein